jgi:integrase/recombinase XerD
MNLSEESIGFYQDSIRYFTDFFCDKKYCFDITLDVVERYIEYQKSKSISSVTVNTYLRGLRAILYFFMEREYMPKFKVKLIRQEKKVKNVYTDVELKLLLAKPDIKKCDFTEYRNWVISNYLLATGNRLGTLCELKISDIDFQNHEILLKKVKNRRQYIIPLSLRLEKILLEYLIYRKGEPDNYLFCNRYGEKLQKGALTTAIKRYNHSRGVEKTSIHLYRHTFAKNWILNGGDIFRLKSILGHSSIDIVKEYAEMFGSDLKRNFDRFNPLDNFGEQKDSGRQSIKMSKNSN